MNSDNSTLPTPQPFANVGPFIPLPVNYVFYSLTLLVLCINLIASFALCIARKSFTLVALPCLKADDPRKKSWLQQVVINALVLFCAVNLISAIFGTVSFVLLERMQMQAWPYISAVDIGFYYSSACLSFVIIGGLILLWLNIAVVWFNMFEQRTMASKVCFGLVVGSLIFFIGVGVVSTLFITFLTFFAPYSVVLNIILTAYQMAQMPIIFSVSFILFIYGVAIGIRVILIMREGVKEEDYYGPLLKKRNVMIRKVLIVLLGVAVSLIVRLIGILVAMNVTSLYAILMLFTRAIPDAAIAWGFVVLFWPYKSAKIVTIDAPDAKELTKAPKKKMQEMKPTSSSSSLNSEAGAVDETPSIPSAETSV